MGLANALVNIADLGFTDLGHKNVETTMIYTHVMRDIKNAPVSPLDVIISKDL